MAASVDDILQYDKNQTDYYAILGCDESSTVEQINAEYKVRALQHHPDKNDGNKESEIIFQKLNEAKEILSDSLKRKNYDKWRHSGIAISFKRWEEMKDHVQQSMHWSKMKNDDRMIDGGTKEVPVTSSSQLQPPVVPRRASEGGVIYTSSKGTFKWENQPTSDVISKFRNYEI